MPTETNAAAWVTPVPLECPGVVRTIRLVRLERSHAADLYAVADPTLFQHSTQGPTEWSVSGFERELSTVLAMPDVVAFAIVLVTGPDAGRAIGRTTYMDIRARHRGLEIGRTWIGRKHQGTRVNPEAKYLMLRHAFEVLTPTAIRVQITTSATNLQSQRAIEKLGAVREGVLRKARIMPPTMDRPEPAIRDWVHYSILDDEWPVAKARLERRLAELA